MPSNKTKVLCLLVANGFTAQASSIDSVFKAQVGSVY